MTKALEFVEGGVVPRIKLGRNYFLDFFGDGNFEIVHKNKIVFQSRK